VNEMLPLHTDGASCWCSSEDTRAATLDAAYPDRCQEPIGLFGGRVCTQSAGHVEPCRGLTNRPGDPCHYCGGPTDPAADDRPDCAACWTDLTTMPMADVKALFAAHDPELSLDPVAREDGGAR
jgi:hypothetical protein